MNLTKQLKSLIGERYVKQSEKLESYLATTSGLKRKVIALVAPGTTKELQEIVRLCSKQNVAFQVFSTGMNWGYGTALPAQEKALLISLERFNKIREYQSSLGYVVLEPGVSQIQLAAFLKENGNEWQMDPTGSSPHCSVLGNALERGLGLGVLGEHAESLRGLEIVLPDGELVLTGFNCDTLRYLSLIHI